MIEWPKPTPQHVGSTRVGGFWVSTTHTIDHGWETMAFPCDEAGTVTDWGEVYCDRYATEEGAKAGHSLACDVMAERVAKGGA